MIFNKYLRRFNLIHFNNIILVLFNNIILILYEKWSDINQKSGKIKCCTFGQKSWKKLTLTAFQHNCENQKIVAIYETKFQHNCES